MRNQRHITPPARLGGAGGFATQAPRLPGLHTPYLVTVALWSLVMVMLFLELPLVPGGGWASAPLLLVAFQAAVWTVHVLWLCRLYRDLERWRVARRPLRPLSLVVVTAFAALLPFTLVWSVCALWLLLRAAERALADSGPPAPAQRLSRRGLRAALIRRRLDLRALFIGALASSLGELAAQLRIWSLDHEVGASRSDLLGPGPTLWLCILSLLVAVWYLWWLGRTIPVLYRSYALIMDRPSGGASFESRRPRTGALKVR